MLCLFFQSSSNNVSYLANGAETTRFRQFRLLCHFSPLWIITFYLPLYIVEMGDPNHVLLLVTTSKKCPLSKCSKLELLFLKNNFLGLPQVFFMSLEASSKDRSTPFYIPFAYFFMRSRFLSGCSSVQRGSLTILTTFAYMPLKGQSLVT